MSLIGPDELYDANGLPVRQIPLAPARSSYITPIPENPHPHNQSEQGSWASDRVAAAQRLRARMIDSSPHQQGDSGQLAYYPAPPHVQRPFDQPSFDAGDGIITPAAGSSSNVVLSLACPNGYNGVIKRLSCNYTGGGFVPFSGDLIWRLRIGGRFARNYDNIRNQLGSIETPRMTDGIDIHSGELLEFLVDVAAAPGIAVGSGTYVVCYVAGYFYSV